MPYSPFRLHKLKYFTSAALIGALAACHLHPGAKSAPNPPAQTTPPGQGPTTSGISGTSVPALAVGVATAAGTIDTSSCDALPADASPPPAASAIRSLTNAEYAASVQDLLQTTGDASAGLPSDAVRGGFDTTATHAFTSTMASAYLETAQQFAAAYTATGTAACADQGFVPSCTSDALLKLAARAFRRPLLDEEKTPLSALPLTLTTAGMAPKEAFATGIATILMAPQFIYRTQLNAVAQIAYPDQLALASRLSYALWSSLPDDNLVALASSGQLSDTGVLSAQIERLLADPKAAAFSRNFAGQWLGSRYLSNAPAAAAVDAALVTAFTAETQAYFAEFLQRNLNVHGLLDGNFSFVNQLLAQHYNITPPATDTLTRVSLDGVQRFGLLSQGSFLLQTSNPDDTSPVKRGKWVLDNILCAAPPPPPNGVAAALDPVNQALPMRDRLAQHRASPACAGCHIRMDPIGLGFENYDLRGKWRDQDSAGRAIDASGTLGTTGSFATPAQLVQLLKADPAFPRCVATKLATYTLGRAPTAREACRIQKIADHSQADSYGLKTMLLDLSLALLVN